MTVEHDEWRGLLTHREDPRELLVIEQPLELASASGEAGGSGVFLARASDGQRWWVKPQNNRQGGKVIVTEHLVASAGSLIQAPTCTTAMVRIPDEFAGWQTPSGITLTPGLAHASLNVEDAQFLRTLDHRDQDDNRRRHVGVFALYDWCWGADDQWLYAYTNDRKLYSHDHGHYLPGGPDWTEHSLIQHVDEPHQPSYSADGLDPNAVDEFAARLDQIGKDPLIGILSSVPLSWPVANEELETLGYFLERRAPAVADRLRHTLKGSL